MRRNQQSRTVPAVEQLESRLLLSHRPGHGDSVGGTPPGTIYFSTAETKQSPIGLCYEDPTGRWSMNGDGTGKSLLPNFPQAAEPSRQLHGDRWVLDQQAVAGTYPSGVQRHELFATRLGDGFKVQLTNDPNMQPTYDWRWAFDDSFLSFDGLAWTPVASGGNFTDASGQQWIADAGIFRAELNWSAGTPAAQVPVEVLDTGLYWATPNSVDLQSDIFHFDWSPNRTQLLYERVTQDSPGGREYHNLYVTTFDSGGFPVSTIQIATGASRRVEPEWSPNGSRIAFSKPVSESSSNQAIWSVNPDGSGPLRITNPGSSGTADSDFHPDWSPDSNSIAFTRYKQSNQKGFSGCGTTWIKNVMRVAATGGTPSELTKDVDHNAYAVAWRSEAQALTASSTGLRATEALRRSQTRAIVAESIARWRAAGVDTSGLSEIEVRIADLPGAYLGHASGHTIWLDADAAGWGWFIDATPWDDSEFGTPGDQGQQGRMDLLTAIAHEVGHLLALDHAEAGVMDDALDPGIRTMPAVRTLLTAPVAVDSILALDWTARRHEHRGDVFEFTSTLIRRPRRLPR